MLSIGDGVISTDAEGRVVSLNEAALSLLRAEEAAVKGRHIDDVFKTQDEFTGVQVARPLTEV